MTRGSLAALAAAVLVASLAACSRSSGKNTAAPPETATATPPPRDIAAQCRELAPQDPIHVEDREGAEKAYAACKEAVAQAPNDAELVYSLALSSLQSYRGGEAIEGFQRAAQLGACGAHYFLGDEAWRSRKSAPEAEKHFQAGAACGDEKAAKEVSPEKTFAGSGRLELAEALFREDMKRLNRARFLTASYVSGFYEALSEQYLGKDFDICWTTGYFKGSDFLYGLRAAEKGDASNIIESYAYEKSLPYVFHFVLPEQGSKALEEFRQTERKAGHADAIRMAENSHCGGLLPYKMLNGVETFAKTKRTLLSVAEEVLPNINSAQDLADWLRQQQRSESNGR